MPELDATTLQALISPALPKGCEPTIAQEFLLTPEGMQTLYIVVDSGHPHSLGRRGYESWDIDAAQNWQPVKVSGKWEEHFSEAVRTFNAPELVGSVLQLHQKQRGEIREQHKTLRDALSSILVQQPSRYFRWASETLRSVFGGADLASIPPHIITDLFLKHNEAKFTAAVDHVWHCDGSDLGWDVADLFLESVDHLNHPLEPSAPRSAQLNRRWQQSVIRFIYTDPVALELWCKLTTIPPSVLQHCHPQGPKWETFAAARKVRSIVELADNIGAAVLNRNFDDYARLACKHNSGHAIRNLLGISPELRAPKNLEAIASYASAFNAPKVLQLIVCWGAPSDVISEIIGPRPFSDGPWDNDIPMVIRPDAHENLVSVLRGQQSHGNPDRGRTSTLFTSSSGKETLH